MQKTTRLIRKTFITVVVSLFIVFIIAQEQKVSAAGPATIIRWDTTLADNRLFPDAEVPGTEFTLHCPPRGYLRFAYGTDIYHPNSSVCTAAVHSGVITNAGGTVRIQISPGQDIFQGSTRNGVTTLSGQSPDLIRRPGFVFI